MSTVLGRSFFERPAPTVAKDLLGKFLVRTYGGREAAYMITEVEAYHGVEDRACHASMGQTARNKVMWDEAGRWYVYFVYGVHWMLNIVTSKRGQPSAVLIRALQDFSSKNLGGQGDKLGGPGKLTKSLNIDGKFYGLPANKKSGLWVEDRGFKIHASSFKTGPRVGVNYAGPYWSRRKWRFWVSQ